jgi:flagellar FliJ protein
MSRRFKFRLATLLRMRETARDQCRAHLAEAYRADELIEQRLEQTRQQLDILQRENRIAVSPGDVELDRVVESQRFELTLRAEQRQLELRRQAVAQEIDHRRQLLLEANREVRVLEQLRDRQEERHRHEQSLREIKQLDEVASLRFARAGEDDA